MYGEYINKYKIYEMMYFIKYFQPMKFMFYKSKEFQIALECM